MNHQIIEYTLKAFSVNENIDKIIVVSNSNYIDKVKLLQEKFTKLTDVIFGGETRILSVYNAIKFLEDKAKPDDNIIISDAARPCITNREISELLSNLSLYQAATTGIKCYETIMNTSDKNVKNILSRDGLIRQTSPEAYKYSVLKWLYLDSNYEIVKDYRNIGIDQLVACGQKIGIVSSNPFNFKITTADDIYFFENLVKTGFDAFIKKN